ncbi:replication initiation protein RepC [Rhizobium leguminosarum bv. viciae]|uniref:plasmid replication protein RepC n=1 Tax=Rhizobium leguminosarum TaxID=384 RepID=UPI00103A44C7|nr:plasmid replication protein RepC [Rhizobium leguminosarum]MBY5494479.1 replication initiation protein RepC [Rhizobium leguminosarum]MBY5530221.1 replication initiation protein RepC [Rhizobium leguminosarum]TBY30822.1 replication initiation protein RepC [Rhizobium leguminosarum bv. viciae]TBY31565.1 replication initiation protein RepC [Rhizobium leguminosarum bv. viciae]TCA99059.1 replication initiation protein RepC [Rhizobium leguminosarum bv. viciae]
MQIGSVTTPFGRRPATLALVKRQIETSKIKPGKTADKWKVFRDASEARELLGLQDRSLAVLDALLSFHPDTELRQDAQLIVFPSNTQLTLRAHGIAGATLRRHLALLVEAGLIVRKDSANGKRYARKDRAGAIDSAFGFDLSPLLMRTDELAMMAQQVVADRFALRRAKENLTICRRDVRKLISAAIEEGASGNWENIEAMYVGLVGRIPRAPTLSDVNSILDEMELLLQEAVNILEMQQKDENNSTNGDQSERHIQNSNTESINELEPSSENEQGAKAVDDGRPKREPVRNFPLGMVMRACPEIAIYGPGGTIGSWREMMGAAVVVRSMLGVSPSAYQEACEVMGPESAATAIACILERAGHINSPGGYLRDLTRKAARGEFSLGPALMALLRVDGDSNRRTG